MKLFFNDESMKPFKTAFITRHYTRMTLKLVVKRLHTENT